MGFVAGGPTIGMHSTGGQQPDWIDGTWGDKWDVREEGEDNLN